MSRLSTNVATVRQRQQLRTGARETTVASMTMPWMLPPMTPQGMFARTAPSLGQSAMAARYGATGLAGPTYASTTAGPAEPGPQAGVLPNFATLAALARGQSERSGWARGVLRKQAEDILARRRRRQQQAMAAERARRAGDFRRVMAMFDEMEGEDQA